MKANNQQQPHHHYVLAWGGICNTAYAFTADRHRRAIAEGAPVNAIYDTDGKWQTVEHIKSLDTALQLQKWCQNRGFDTSAVDETIVKIKARLELEAEGAALVRQLVWNEFDRLANLADEFDDDPIAYALGADFNYTPDPHAELEALKAAEPQVWNDFAEDMAQTALNA